MLDKENARPEKAFSGYFCTSGMRGSVLFLFYSSVWSKPQLYISQKPR